MQTNQTLEKLLEHLSLSVPDWEEVMRRYCCSDRARSSDVHKNLAEMFLVSELEKIVAKENLPVQLHVIKGGERAGDSVFSRHHGRTRVHYLNYAPYEIGEVALVDGLPVLLEIKTGTWRRRGLRYQGNSSRGAYSAFLHSIYEKSLCPLRQLFSIDPGYVVVLPSDHYRTQSRLIQQFLEAGGRVAPLPQTRAEFGEGMNSVRMKYGI